MLPSQCKFKTREKRGCFCQAQHRMEILHVLSIPADGPWRKPGSTRPAALSLSSSVAFQYQKRGSGRESQPHNSQYPKYTEILLPEMREGFSWFWEIKRFLQKVVDPAQCLGDAKGTAWMIAGSCSLSDLINTAKQHLRFEKYTSGSKRLAEGT